MAFVRQSKLRHVFGQPFKKEQCFDNVRITKSAWDGPFCAVNPKWFACLSDASGGAAFYVFDLSKPGRVDVDAPMIAGHKAAVLDLQFCPHDDDIIASAGEDCAVRVWRIPEEGVLSTITEPVVTLSGHQKRVGCLAWHPVIAGVLISGGQDGKVIAWDVQTAEPLVVLEIPSYVLCMAFNYNGSRLAVTCKDKQLRILDLRGKRILGEVQAHDGAKPSMCTYVSKSDGRILTTGFSKMSKRCFALWDEKDLSKPIAMDEIDSSNGTMYPFFDYDLGLLFLLGKGDSSIRYFEVNNDAPYVHYLSSYSSSDPQRGFGYMPKRGVNVTVCEVARIFRMYAKNWIEIIPFIAPRKAELFQDDLFPDTIGDVPALSAKDWISGKDAEPILISLRDYQPTRKPVLRILPSKVADSGQSHLPSPVTLGNAVHVEKAAAPPRTLAPAAPSPVTVEPAKPIVVDAVRSNGTAGDHHENNSNDDLVVTVNYKAGAGNHQNESRQMSVSPSNQQSTAPDCDPTMVSKMESDIKKLKIIAKGQEIRVKSVEDRLAGLSTDHEARIQRLEELLRPGSDTATAPNGGSSLSLEHRIGLLEHQIARLLMTPLARTPSGSASTHPVPPENGVMSSSSNPSSATSPSIGLLATTTHQSNAAAAEILQKVYGQLSLLVDRISSMESRLERIEAAIVLQSVMTGANTTMASPQSGDGLKPTPVIAAVPVNSEIRPPSAIEQF